VIRAIVFDVDNTLVDFMKMKDDAVNAAVDGMIDAGLKLPGATGLKRLRKRVKDRIEGIYTEKGIEHKEVFDDLMRGEFGHVNPRILASGILAYRRARDSALVPYPHIQLTLVQLMKRGIQLGVVSDAPREQVWSRLCALSFHHVFDAVVTYEDTRRRKPDPAPFRRVLDRLGVEPHEALMIGDWAKRDIRGARKLGMKTALARYGRSPITLGSTADMRVSRDSRPDYNIHDPPELLRIVDDENGPPAARVGGDTRPRASRGRTPKRRTHGGR
jgi:HAD superfamily hydrolase (TIGR01509 family)